MALLMSLLLAQAAPTPDIVANAVREQDCRSRSTSDDIIVCGRRQVDERYRLPDRDRPFDPDGETDSVMRERGRWIEGGETGNQSCGPVGPAGWTGCMVREWSRQLEQSQWGKNRPTRKW